jgi:hypothetical protein
MDLNSKLLKVLHGDELTKTIIYWASLKLSVKWSTVYPDIPKIWATLLSVIQLYGSVPSS